MRKVPSAVVCRILLVCLPSLATVKLGTGSVVCIERHVLSHLHRGPWRGCRSGLYEIICEAALFRLMDRALPSQPGQTVRVVYIRMSFELALSLTTSNHALGS